MSVSDGDILNELTFDDPCILFALGRESRAFRREFRPQQRFSGAPCWARFCGPSWLSVLVLETGVGAQRTENVVQWLSQGPLLGKVPYVPKVVVSAGFAGAVQENLQAGDVLLATEVIDLDGNRWPATWPGDLPGGDWKPVLHRGRLLTVPRLVATPQDKAELGRKHDAQGIDMESAVVARMCNRSGIPFGCVRAISDDVRTALSPRLVSLLSAGRVSPWRLLLALGREPRIALELGRLAKQTRRAANQLGLALGELLTLTLPGGSNL
jgi:adenosylhomocysteine nucleosidase